MFGLDPMVLVLGAILYLYLVMISLKFPLIPAAIYPFTFLNFTQTTFAVGGVSPSKYIGFVLIFVGLFYLAREFLSKAHRNYSLLGFFSLLMLFPTWILVRFLIEGSDLNLAYTFLLNALTTFSIVVIVNSERRKTIMEISLGATFVVLSMSMIAAYFFPSLTLLRSLQQGEFFRTIGLVNDPNYGGAFIAIGFAFFLSKAVLFYDARKMRLFYFSLSLIAISLFSLLLTVSRAAILSAVVCLLMTTVYGRIRLRHIAWVVPSLGILLVLYWSFPDLIDALVYRMSITRFDPSNVARLEFYRAGIAAIQENLWWGLGNYSGYHNAYLDVTAFGGLFAFGFFAILIFVVLRLNMSIMSIGAGDFRESARFVVLGLITFLFNGLFIGMETERITWYLFGWGMINYILFKKSQQNTLVVAASDLPSRSWSENKRLLLSPPTLQK